MLGYRRPFPDLKGQAPLRPRNRRQRGIDSGLFLTSKVRLHCDLAAMHMVSGGSVLFLTSKVRLHCDLDFDVEELPQPVPFPDLKGQAPLRLVGGFHHPRAGSGAFS